MSTEFQHSGDVFLSSEQVAQLCDWIDAHIHESIGWADLTQQSGAEHKTIMASFHKHLATTPMTWIRQRRAQLNIPELAPVVDTHLMAFLRKDAPCSEKK
jgi:AraC-like DNA-binding protein